MWCEAVQSVILCVSLQLYLPKGRQPDNVIKPQPPLDFGVNKFRLSTKKSRQETCRLISSQKISSNKIFKITQFLLSIVFCLQLVSFQKLALELISHYNLKRKKIFTEGRDLLPTKKKLFLNLSFNELLAEFGYFWSRFENQIVVNFLNKATFRSQLFDFKRKTTFGSNEKLRNFRLPTKNNFFLMDNKPRKKFQRNTVFQILCTTFQIKLDKYNF